MKSTKLIALLLLCVVSFLYACEQGTDVVESGTYQGTVDKVEAEKTEIYVKTEDGKRLELYFNENTSLTRNGETVAFDQLEEGTKVEVEVEKVGQRLDPIAVSILE
jgi:cold shock protein